MSTRRTAKVAEAIRQVVSTAILFELRDPRVQHVTVLRVETPVDLRTSKVFVSVLGDEKTQRLTMKGLDAARGFLQSKIAEILDLRFTPVLTFVLDQGVKKSIETSRMLRKLDVEEAALKAQAGAIPADETDANTFRRDYCNSSDEAVSVPREMHLLPHRCAYAEVISAG